MRRAPGTATKLPELTEKQWQNQVTSLAKTLGYKVYHTFLSRWSDAGFPDLVLVGHRVIYAELKREKGKCTESQAGWIRDLRLAGAEVYVWRPSDWDEVVEVLQRRGRAGV